MSCSVLNLKEKKSGETLRSSFMFLTKSSTFTHAKTYIFSDSLNNEFVENIRIRCSFKWLSSLITGWRKMDLAKGYVNLVYLKCLNWLLHNNYNATDAEVIVSVRNTFYAKMVYICSTGNSLFSILGRVHIIVYQHPRVKISPSLSPPFRL